MGMLEDGLDFLTSEMTEHASRTVSYTQEGKSIASIAAVVGRTVFRFVDSYGIDQRIETRDFLVEIADFVDDEEESQLTPKRGGQFTETINGESVVFEVASPNTGEPWFRRIDHDTRFRIHTQRLTRDGEQRM